MAAFLPPPRRDIRVPQGSRASLPLFQKDRHTPPDSWEYAIQHRLLCQREGGDSPRTRYISSEPTHEEAIEARPYQARNQISMSARIAGNHPLTRFIKRYWNLILNPCMHDRLNSAIELHFQDYRRVCPLDAGEIADIIQ